MNSLKRLVKSVIHSVGFDIHYLNPASNPSFQLLKALERFKIDLVLDVGANVGQFSSELRSVGYRVALSVLSRFLPHIMHCRRWRSGTPIGRFIRAAQLVITMARLKSISLVILFRPHYCR